MASESISILISADNQASSVIKTVGTDLEGMAKKAKDTGQKTKASVEIVGSLANAFGGSALGAFSAQLGQITEKVSAFSEVAKTGTVGAMAFKVGIAAAIGAVTYKVTETVASWWFEIDKATESAKNAEKEFTRASAAMGDVRQKAYGEMKVDLSLVRDPVDRERATAEAAARLERQSADLDKQIADAQARLADKQKAFNAAWMKDRAKVDVDVARDQLENLKALRDSFDRESESLRDLTSERTKSIEARKAENAAKDKSDSFLKTLRDEIELLKATKEEQQSLEATRNAVPEQQSVAKVLIEERDALKAKLEEQKKNEQEMELARKKEEDGLKRIEELERKRLIDLEARRIELEKGREAAAAYRLEQDGLSKATAQRLAEAEEDLRVREQFANLKTPSSLPAFESRVMTRGTAQDQQLTELRKLQEAQRKTAEETAKNGKTLERIYEESKRRGQFLEVQVVK